MGMMETYFITEKDFPQFLSNMVEKETVYGPVAKKTKFAFSRLKQPEYLRLDYDVTMLPPKKMFFPPVQKLIDFDGSKYHGCIDPERMVLFGVHFYDIKALDMTDFLFADNKKDMNYLANREAATIVGSSVQNISERAFWGSIGRDIKPKGHDAFLTKTGNRNGESGYILEVRTEKGEALLKYGNFVPGSESDIAEAERINEELLDKCPEKLKYGSNEIAENVRASFSNEALWSELATDCFSCGTCNTVCPTCYCFDVHDLWNLDQHTGSRTRYWDACLTTEFARVSLGAGDTENFRDSRGERFRHRIMRKGAYLNEKLGGPACVGCGRCSAACTADIADPVRVIDKIMETYSELKPVEPLKEKYENIFLPREAKIIRTVQATATEKHFTLQLADGSRMDFEPGQFLEVSLFGYGEIPIGYASSPTRKNTFDIVVRTVGRVSTAINKLNKGDSLFIRGPLGNGFHLDNFQGHNVLIIAGGIGICPTRSLIQYIIDQRGEFKDFTLFYGMRDPSQRMFKEDIEKWKSMADVNYFETVDVGDESWEGNVGVITTLFEKTTIPPDTRVVICGPPVMFKFVIRELGKINIPHEHIYVDLERRMKCGVGKCGHCQINDKYVCLDGPVFSYTNIEGLEEAL